MAVAMSVNYYTVNGMILAEDRGGVYSEFVPDTLGSCVAVKDSTETITYTADYWPYGEVRTSTGSKSSPWGFVGLLGYLTDLAKRLYIRARHYRPNVGEWQTVDPLWPDEAAYVYVGNQPGGFVDPSGLRPLGDQFPILFPPVPKPKPISLPVPAPPFWPPRWDDPRWRKRWGGRKPRPKGYVLPYPYFDERGTYWGYGNWCGQGRPGAGNIEGFPMDELDGCCLAHDKYIGKCKINGEDGCAHCLLLQCAKGADCKTSPTPWACEAARGDIIAFFTFPCIIEAGWNLRCMMV